MLPPAREHAQVDAASLLGGREVEDARAGGEVVDRGRGTCMVAASHYTPAVRRRRCRRSAVAPTARSGSRPALSDDRRRAAARYTWSRRSDGA